MIIDHVEYSDYIKNLDEYDQNNLKDLFLDWFDLFINDPCFYHQSVLFEIRKRINVCTTTGVNIIPVQELI